MTERCCAASFLKVNRTETEINNGERGLDSSGKMAAVLNHCCSHQAGVFLKNYISAPSLRPWGGWGGGRGVN